MRLQGSGVRMISLAMDNGHRNGNYHLISGELSHRRLKPMANSSSVVSWSSSCSDVNYIEHHVSKMDTLAGVAIRYGVEVSDIKRLNGLVTDLQMFAHKSLQIPLPGRHPPSPIISDGSVMQENGNSDRVPPRYAQRKLFKDLPPVELKPQQGKVSAAMSSLQGYYGLAAENDGNGDEGTEMILYKIKRGDVTADEPPSSIRANEDADSCPGKHRSSTSLLNGFYAGSSDESLGDAPVAEAGNYDTERSNEKPVRRRQRIDDPANPGSDLVLKEDTTSSGLSGRSGLALRLKSASRVNLAGADAGSANNHAHPFGDSLFANGFAGVRRSSSTSNLQEPLDTAASNRSASKWTLRSDLQVLTAVAIPMFDGLPKPISGKRNKAALD